MQGLFLLCLLGLSYSLTGVIRRRALRMNFLDVPNQRSSHVLPTARGGGLAFVLCFLLSLLLLGWGDRLPFSLLSAFSVISVGIAGIGWLDDRHHVVAWQRLMVHLLVVAVAIFCLDAYGWQWGMLSVGITTILSVLYVMSLINVFNFLDGIDGYVVMEAIFVAGSLAGMSFQDGFSTLPLMLSGLGVMVLGFGVWNFPRAKIFMGDVGSGFLGGVIGIFTLALSIQQPLYVVLGLMLMAGFIVDASMTLAVRAYHRERIWEAHCQHAYQHAAKHMQSHVPVTLGMGLFNSVYILPLAWLVWQQHCTPWVGLVGTYLPMIGLAWYWRAGQKTPIAIVE